MTTSQRTDSIFKLLSLTAGILGCPLHEDGPMDVDYIWEIPKLLK